MSGALSNFPMLVSLPNGTLTTTANGGHVASSSGYDIVFTSDSGCSQSLNYEVEQWSPSAGNMLAWVRVPTLSHTVNTTVFLCYGNGSINSFQGGSPGSVWDSNYKVVNHFANGTTLSVIDSTGNGNNGTLANSPTATTGKIDGGIAFGNQIGAYTNNTQSVSNRSPTGLPPAAGPLTLELWMNTPVAGGTQQFIFHGTDGGSNSFDLCFDAYRNLVVKWNGGYAMASAPTPVQSVWHHVVYITTASGYTGRTLYIDGVAYPATQTYPDPGFSIASYFLGGSTTGGGWYPYNGSLDEFRLSNTARSADWITTEYNNQNSPTSFSTLGAENSGGGSAGHLESRI